MYQPPSTRSLLEALRKEAEKSPFWRNRIQRHKAGDTLLEEGAINETLHLILSGAVELSKRTEDTHSARVDLLEAGSLLGLISVTTTAPALTSARAVSDVELLVVEREDFETLGRTNPAMKSIMDLLVIRNLADRYRRLVGSNLEIHRLARALNFEKAQLAETISNLKATRMAFISQEKMATLGQLVAGVAHELNNPAASMLHAIGALGESLQEILKRINPAWAETFRSGLHRQPIDSALQRRRMETLAARHPSLERPLIRRLSLLPPETCEALLSEGNAGALESALTIFESGNSVRGIAVAAGRIARLVKSLKSHSRDGRDEWEYADVAEGIRDTLLVLAKPLRGIEVEIRMDDLPQVYCRPGALNQVWTNLIVNAAEAMKGSGMLRISAHAADDWLHVRIEDSGPSFPPHMLDNLFTMNFTTKSGASSFGLGLGLGIAKEIISQHNGSIEAEKKSPDLGGAVFKVKIPLQKQA